MNFKLDLDYIDVSQRIAAFREKHPEGSLQQHALEFREVAGVSWVVYTAAAYRTPDDPRPGIGTAWEPVPGKTPYTRDSELQNAETAAWGRAIVAVLAADTKRGIASAEEVRNRSAGPEENPFDPAVAELNEAKAEVKAAWEAAGRLFVIADVEAAYDSDHDARLADASPAELLAFAQDLRAQVSQQAKAEEVPA